MTSTLFRHAVTEYSIILGGRVGVGKTSLYRRILYDTFSEDSRAVTGLERGVYSTQVNGENVKVQFVRVNCPVESWPWPPSWARLYYSHYMEYSNVIVICSP